MRRWVLVAAILAAITSTAGCAQVKDVPDLSAPSASASASETIAAAFRDHKSGVPVSGRGVVTRVLADDNDGSRHQRFILRLESGQTLLFVHNVDIAPRLDPLRVGDVVEFIGIYEWNARGGLVHWTHRDPAGQHAPGRLRLRGQTYE